MRVYLHYEGPLGPSHTKRVSVKEGEVILASKALATFVASYEEAHGSTSMAAETMMLTCNGKTLDLNAPLAVKDKSDLNVEPLAGGVSAKAPSSSTTQAASSQATKPPDNLPTTKAKATATKPEAAPKAAAKPTAAVATSKAPSASRSAEQSAATAADLTSKGRLREARLVLERALLAQPQHAPSLKALGELAARRGNDLQAAECYGQAVDAYQKMGGSKGSVKVEEGAVAALLGQGKALCKLGDLGRAIACCQVSILLTNLPWPHFRFCFLALVSPFMSVLTIVYLHFINLDGPSPAGVSSRQQKRVIPARRSRPEGSHGGVFA